MRFPIGAQRRHRRLQLGDGLRLLADEGAGDVPPLLDAVRVEGVLVGNGPDAVFGLGGKGDLVGGEDAQDLRGQVRVVAGDVLEQ